MLAEQIASAVSTYKLDGVNVDIENLTYDDRANYVDFVHLLREALPDKEVSVAVAANPNGTTRDWQGSYDYAGLAKYSTGTYTIWYANETTTKNTLTLVGKYDILGASSWSLGQESANTWSYYDLWLNGVYFNDIQYHWAKNTIFNAYKQGWIKGVSTNSFAPNSALTRAQAATMLVRALGLPVDPTTPGSFEDTLGHWAEAEIETAKEHHIIQGVGEGLFEPESA